MLFFAINSETFYSIHITFHIQKRFNFKIVKISKIVI
jgi:hypothetical protein